MLTKVRCNGIRLREGLLFWNLNFITPDPERASSGWLDTVSWLTMVTESRFSSPLPSNGACWLPRARSVWYSGKGLGTDTGQSRLSLWQTFIDGFMIVYFLQSLISSHRCHVYSLMTPHDLLHGSISLSVVSLSCKSFHSPRQDFTDFEQLSTIIEKPECKHVYQCAVGEDTSRIDNEHSIFHGQGGRGLNYQKAAVKRHLLVDWSTTRHWTWHFQSPVKCPISGHSNLGFNILLKDTSSCSQGIETAAFRLLDDPLHLLSHSHPTNASRKTKQRLWLVPMHKIFINHRLEILRLWSSASHIYICFDFLEQLNVFKMKMWHCFCQ